VVGSLGRPTHAHDARDFADFGPFLRIARDGFVTVVSKHSELGQGAQSGLAAIVAEELDADWRRVSVEMAPADVSRYAHTRIPNLQITGGSSSISNSWDQLRRVGASARTMFVAAAALRWAVSAADLEVRDGVVHHPGSGRKMGFGELVQAASRQTPPPEPPLKRVESFTLIGTDRVHRLDSRSKSNGTQKFGIDVDEPGMLTAVVAHPPWFGGRLVRFDAKAARVVPGVVDVFAVPSGVAVVAEGFYAATRGRDALEVEWNDSDAELRSSDEIREAHRRMAWGEQDAHWIDFEVHGEMDEDWDDERSPAQFAFDFPYLAHATLEPMTCVARVDGTRVKLEYGAQSQTADQRNIAPIVGCRPEDVEIETLPCGGSFGRRSVATSDYQTECVHIARRVGGGTPVKLVWTREDDMAGGDYRPMAHHAIRVRLGADGFPTAWDHRIVSASLVTGTQFEPEKASEAAEIHITEGAKDSPYLRAIPSVRGRMAYFHSPVTVGWLRSVGATHTATAMEHTIDQLARRAGIDPVDYRRTLYRKAGAERHLTALELAAERAGWGQPMEEGWARGVAVHECFGSVVANVAEVCLDDRGPRVRRVVVAVDCGIAVSPDQVRAQMEGGVIFGLSMALFGNVELEQGQVRTTNFDTYRVLRMAESPVVETHIVPSTRAPTGTGEPGTPVIAPAVANALLALTGDATIRLPLT
jgi:isoquinoline 1-oxidoreductase beta subunit